MEYARTALGPVPLSPVRGLVRKEAIMASTHTPEETRAEVSGSDVAQELQELAETLTTLGDVGNKIVNHRAHLELLADVDADEDEPGRVEWGFYTETIEHTLRTVMEKLRDADKAIGEAADLRYVVGEVARLIEESSPDRARAFAS